MVEGIWKNFEFKFITKDNYLGVLEHVQEVYCRDELMMKYSGYTPELVADFRNIVQHILEEDSLLSFVVIESSTGKLAGIQIADSVHVEDPPGFPLQFKSNQVARLEHQLVSLVTSCKIFEKFGVNKYAEVLYTSIDPEFRGQGLGTEIFRRSISLYKSLGYFVCMSEFTSPSTRAIGHKVGFTEILNLKFRDFRDKTGIEIFPNANEHDFVSIMVVDLRQ